MYEIIDHLAVRAPAQTFKAVHGPTIAKWTMKRRHAVHEAELFQDLARHPWVGERQAGKAANLFTMTARGVDKELLALPYAQRLTMSRGGLWPLVVGGELGEGPDPWSGDSNKNYDKMKKRYGPGGGPPHDGGRDGWRNFGRHTSSAGMGVEPTRMDVDEPPEGPAAPPPPTPPLPLAPAPAAPLRPRARNFGDRLRNVGTHLANSAGEVAVTGGASYLGGLAGTAVGQPEQGARFAARTANYLYRRATPMTGAPVGNGTSFARQAVGVARTVRRLRRENNDRGLRSVRYIDMGDN